MFPENCSASLSDLERPLGIKINTNFSGDLKRSAGMDEMDIW